MVQQLRRRLFRLWFILVAAVLAGIAWQARGTASAQSKKNKGTASYQLAAAPLEIYDRLAELKMGDVPAIGAEEREFLAKRWKLKAERPDDKFDDSQLLE